MLELVLLVVALVVSWTLLGHLFDASIAAPGGRDACPSCGAKLEQLGWLGTVVLQDGKEAEGSQRVRLLECPSCFGEFHEEPDGTITPR